MTTSKKKIIKVFARKSFRQVNFDSMMEIQKYEKEVELINENTR